MNSKSLTLVSGLFSLFTAAVLAAPPNTITMDGRPLEYDATELVGFSTNLSNNFGPGNVITNLYVTWDEDYLYIGLQGEENNNKMAVLVDADPGNGTGANTTTNWSSPFAEDGKNHIRFNDVGWQVSTNLSATPFGLDYMIASEGFFNNYIRILYDGTQVPDTTTVVALFDVGNGNTPQGGPVDVVVQSDGTINPLKGFESRIAWSNFYMNTGRFGTVNPGDVVPTGATIRLIAVLHNNDPVTAHSTDGIIPNQSSVNASYGGFVWTSDDYIDVVIDGDNDGFPDVAVGDVNSPYLKYLSGVQGQRQVFAWFNEDVTALTAGDPLNWLVDNGTPESVAIVQPDAVLLTLTNDLPAAGSLVRVTATGVEDAAANSKVTFNYFDPAVSGIETSITVRFLLNINSGFGAVAANPRATNFFVNGGAAPLEFGFPPVMTSPLTTLNATQHYRDVTFPPGTATKIFYKYSGELTQGGLATGTNNYEAIRLDNFADKARELTLPTNGITSLVVTDWLGAAAAPYRNPGTNTGYNALYLDARRGDAGVRQRTTMLFQLDLSQRNLQGVTRVLVQGTDPLRGFNVDGGGISDFAGSGAVGWDVGGIDLVDDGSLGDQVAGDGTFSRVWVFSTNGFDSVAEPEFPYSLVAGTFDTLPYAGFSWQDRRSPRTFKYKFYVYKAGSGETLDSPSSDIEYYIEGSPTNIVFPTFAWDNNSLPLPPPSNSPTMLANVPTGALIRVVFTNQPSELQHGVEISTNLIQGWLDFGSRATTTTVSGVWQANIANSTASENYRAFAGPPKPFSGVWMEPYPIPATGATVRVYYTQHSRVLTGNRSVHIAGNFSSWSGVPMTFMGDGLWYYDLVANTSVFPNTEIKFKPVDKAAPTIYDGMGGGGNDFFFYVGDLRASYSNPHPTNGELFTITYDANGGPLAASTNVRAYVGFDEQWNDAGNRAMTNTLGNTNIWEVTFAVPTNTALSINFVFNGTIGAGTTWDSEGSAPPNGRQWRIFIDKPE